MIKITELKKSFGTKEVLKGINLEIKDGETLTIIGGSGCGKSVLLKHIVGLMSPDSGSVFIDGQDITKLDRRALSKVQEKFGFLFQGGALFDSLSVEENVGFGLRNLTDFTPEQIRRRVGECLSMIGLSGIEKLKPAELSGGMKKRVALARAIAVNPGYIFYDEPTTGIDPIMADVINNLIIHLKNTMRVTSVVVTHDMTSAYKISDTLAMLYEGKIIGQGSPEEIKRTDNPFIRQFVHGSSDGPIKMKIRRE